MKRKLARIVSLSLCSAVLVSGCGIGGSKSDGNEGSGKASGVTDVVQSMTTEDANAVPILSIKEKYGVADESKRQYKPFYNVEQNTQFTFHFKSNVEPCKAITVHTDSKCEESSTVYQINDGYKTADGLDVVVKAGSPVLNNPDHAGGELANYNWGYAPIYYMCIRYDMDSEVPMLLDEPIVIPFTVRSDVSVPNTYYNITPDGQFEIEWQPVDDAVKYNIYSAFRVRLDSKARNMSRAEAGYVGDHLEKVAEVDGNTFKFSDWASGTGFSGTTGVDSYGYVYEQNKFLDSGSYYVTAVDSSGNESFYSYPIEGWKCSGQLPSTFDPYGLFERNSNGYVTYLPMSVPVSMVDGSEVMYPINYKKISDNDYYSQYEYSIVGTMFTGSVDYYSESGDYADSYTSTDKVNGDLYKVSNTIQTVPSNDVQTLNGVDNIDLTKQVVREQNSKLIYSKDALLKRADIENARMIYDGVYPEGSGLDSIYTYIDTNFTPVIVQNEEDNSGESGSEVSESAETSEPVIMEEVDEVTSDNLVDKQQEIVEKEVENADNIVIHQTGYPVWADSAEEEYLAMCMINHEEVFTAAAFPKLQNMEYLADVFYKVIYQNPYVVSPKNLAYDFDSQTIVIEYAYDEETTKQKQGEIALKSIEIADSVIDKSMSDTDKVKALWDYLEAHTVYDYDALEAAEAYDFMLPDGFEDSFNAYGILVNNKGVCQSYAYAYKLLLDCAGVESMTLVGYLNGSLPHAWNAVSLDGDWYWLDATNNKDVTGVPYFLYQTSSDFADSIQYVLGDEYELDSNLGKVLNSDNSMDYYVVNNLYAMNDAQVIDIAVSEYMKASSGDVVAVKCAYEPEINEGFVTGLVTKLSEAGVSREDIENLKAGYYNGYFVAFK